MIRSNLRPVSRLARHLLLCEADGYDDAGNVKTVYIALCETCKRPLAPALTAAQATDLATRHTCPHAARSRPPRRCVDCQGVLRPGRYWRCADCARRHSPLLTDRSPRPAPTGVRARLSGPTGAPAFPPRTAAPPG